MNPGFLKYTSSQGLMNFFRIRRYHKDMEGLRYGIRKVRQGTCGGLDGQYKRHTHLCEVNLSYSPSLLTQAVPH